MKCVNILVIIVVFYILYDYIEYYIDDKFETIEVNRDIEKYFDDNINVFVINLPNQNNRMKFMKDQLDKQNIKYTRIEAQNAKNYDKQFIDNWPTLYGKKYNGTKGLYLSNIIAMKEALINPKKWTMIFEDDVKITKNFKNKVYQAIMNNKDINVFNFDKLILRNLNVFMSKIIYNDIIHTGTYMYKTELLPFIIKELDYRSSNYLKYYNATPNAIFDNYISWLLLSSGNDIKVIPLNKKDMFNSTITPTKITGRVPFTSGYHTTL